MMYSEFVAGTGCKENEHNYKVYKDLEIMYMNSDMSKAEIYEYGKKLVDNSKSEEQIRFEQDINDQIEAHKAEIATYKRWIRENETMVAYWKEQNDKEMVAFYRNPIKYWKQEVRSHKTKIEELKWVLA